MAYSPKYVNIDDVPVRQVPDDYDLTEKEDALEFAESSIELDIFDGSRIPSDRVTVAVETAIKQKATCELVKGAEDPTSTKLGDIADDGTNKQDYASSFCERYEEIVEKLNDSDLFEESNQQSTPYVYTTRASDRDC